MIILKMEIHRLQSLTAMEGLSDSAVEYSQQCPEG